MITKAPIPLSQRTKRQRRLLSRVGGVALAVGTFVMLLACLSAPTLSGLAFDASRVIPDSEITFVDVTKYQPVVREISTTVSLRAGMSSCAVEGYYPLAVPNSGTQLSLNTALARNSYATAVIGGYYTAASPDSASLTTFQWYDETKWDLRSPMGDVFSYTNWASGGQSTAMLYITAAKSGGKWTSENAYANLNVFACHNTGTSPFKSYGIQFAHYEGDFIMPTANTLQYLGFYRNYCAAMGMRYSEPETVVKDLSLSVATLKWPMHDFDICLGAAYTASSNKWNWYSLQELPTGIAFTTGASRGSSGFQETSKVSWWVVREPRGNSNYMMYRSVHGMMSFNPYMGMTAGCEARTEKFASEKGMYFAPAVAGVSPQVLSQACSLGNRVGELVAITNQDEQDELDREMLKSLNSTAYQSLDVESTVLLGARWNTNDWYWTQYNVSQSDQRMTFFNQYGGLSAPLGTAGLMMKWGFKDQSWTTTSTATTHVACQPLKLQLIDTIAIGKSSSNVGLDKASNTASAVCTNADGKYWAMSVPDERTELSLERAALRAIQNGDSALATSNIYLGGYSDGNKVVNWNDGTSIDGSNGYNKWISTVTTSDQGPVALNMKDGGWKIVTGAAAGTYGACMYDPPKKAAFKWWIILIVVLVVVAILVSVLVTVICCCCKKPKSEVEYIRVEVEDEMPDRRLRNTASRRGSFVSGRGGSFANKSSGYVPRSMRNPTTNPLVNSAGSVRDRIHSRRVSSYRNQPNAGRQAPRAEPPVENPPPPVPANRPDAVPNQSPSRLRRGPGGHRSGLEISDVDTEFMSDAKNEIHQVDDSLPVSVPRQRYNDDD